MLYLVRFFTLLIFITTSHPAFSSFFSEIFQEREDGLHVVLRGVDKNGDEWATCDMTQEHRDFLRALYSDANNLKNYGTGGARPENHADILIKDYGKQSRRNTPLGGWIVERTRDHVPMGTFYLSACESHPGVAEISRLIAPQYQGIGLGASVMQAIVKVWAPSVRILGKDNEKFRCFRNQALERLYVSCSPDNLASRTTQLRAGFVNLRADQSYPAIDLRGACETYEQLVVVLERLYDPPQGKEPLVKDLLYRLRDHNGQSWTFSYRSKLGKIRFHFIHMLDSSSGASSDDPVGDKDGQALQHTNHKE